MARRPRGRLARCARALSTSLDCALALRALRAADAPAACSGAAELLVAVRDSLQLNFGDAALGAALASLQGAPACRLALR